MTTLDHCRHCEGEHLYGLAWRHATSCPLYEQDSATIASDHARGRGVRPLAPHEAELTAGAFTDPPEEWSLAVRFEHAGGIDDRLIVERLDGPYLTTRPATRITDKETDR